jgi:hypothetical protein
MNDERRRLNGCPAFIGEFATVTLSTR